MGHTFGKTSSRKDGEVHCVWVRRKIVIIQLNVKEDEKIIDIGSAVLN